MSWGEQVGVAVSAFEGALEKPKEATFPARVLDASRRLCQEFEKKQVSQGRLFVGTRGIVFEFQKVVGKS